MQSLTLTLTGAEAVLYCFPAGVLGFDPTGGLVADSLGNFYGTMTSGGPVSNACSTGCGVVYELSLVSGEWMEKVLYPFTGMGGDGKTPYAPLIRDSNGHLYGTTAYGGSTNCTLSSGGCGIVFQVN